MKGHCITKGNTKTQTPVTLAESSAFAVRFDSSVTGDNRGYARACSAGHDSSDKTSLCTVFQLPHGKTRACRLVGLCTGRYCKLFPL